MNVFFASILLLAFGAHAYEMTAAQQDYYTKWKPTAMENMRKYNIPASITLAQGMLESGYGSSELAQKANNHFGIKCSDWKGATYMKKEGSAETCYRKYSSAKQSYEDHAAFLVGRKHYASLFTLKNTDYKAWAHGLQKAGYATSTEYPKKLISLIEKLGLHELDKEVVDGKAKGTDTPKGDKSQRPSNTTILQASTNKHEVHMTSTKVKYVVAQAGDTYYRIAKEFELGMWQLRKYNDFDGKKDVLEPGDIVFLQPKRRKGTKKAIELTQNMSLRELSQKEGIKLSALLERNKGFSPDEVLQRGDRIALR